MKGRQIVLGHLFGAEAAALVIDGQLHDLIADPAPVASLAPGAILRGKVERLMKGQGGVFVRLPDGARGWLRDRAGVGEGQIVIVQVTGAAEDGKAIPVTNRLLLKGRFGIVTPAAPGVNVSRRLRDPDLRDRLTTLGESVLDGRAHGLILRSACGDAADDEIRDDIAPLADLADQLLADRDGPPELLLDATTPWDQAWMEWNDPPPDQVDEGENAFELHGVLDAVDALLHAEISLPGGASAMIEPTRALVAVDVNTGADTSPAAALKANIAVARDLPRQLRLRGLGGQVVIDFAPMPKRDRAVLDQVLRASFKGEAAETVLSGWTAMGLFELNRKRDRLPLARLAAAARGM
ncbi:MAG: ribonuclease E/G [Paracoccus sp. (in: a-proteobacteria)]|uniref:ribonuclease E/G n=1 Tax=Paracoccus sp. TaxID=267 RepID=UPI0026E0A8AD|nr:ribonuclease E/G [Paracoccus sp. (in: a-proteobacteria)]MDO5612829.1 ribonuclease E/G [Paracoccus sp. (in: a-proteobacteria)]